MHAESAATRAKVQRPSHSTATRGVAPSWAKRALELFDRVHAMFLDVPRRRRPGTQITGELIEGPLHLEFLRWDLDFRERKWDRLVALQKQLSFW
jgi:hypothetical protein